MASVSKSVKREQVQHKRKHGMRVSGKSLIHIQNAIIKRSKKEDKDA
jgi:hypothetical protein